MPMVEAPVLPREVGSKLARVRWRLRGVALALAGERTVLALTAAAVLSFLLDKGIEPELGELAVMRTLTLFLFASALATGAVFGALALKRRLNDDAVAVLVEREYPELEDGLVSSVQLARDLERGGLGHTSPALIRSTIARTAQKSQGLDFDRVIDASPLLLPTFLTLLALVGGGVFASQPPTNELASTWFQRCVLGRDVRYPKTIELAVTVAGERDNFETAVARGDDVTVDIVVKKGAWKVERPLVKTFALRKDETTGRLELVRDREPERTHPAQVGTSQAAQYRKIYQNVTEPFEFVVDAGDVRSERHRVVVVDRPRIEEARFWLKYPEYMGIPDTPQEKPETQPDLRVPVGTEIAYRALCNKPLAKAELKFELEDTKAPKPQTGQAVPTTEQTGPPPQIGGDDKLALRVLTGKFTVERTMRFRFTVQSTDGYDDGKKPVVFSVTAVVDRPPEVKILVPGRPKQVTPIAKVPLKVEVSQDYGVVAAEVRLRFETQEARPSVPGAPGPPAGEEKVHLAGLEEGAKKAVLDHALELSDYALKPGDRVTYKAVAFDRNTDATKRMGESTSYVLSVISKEDLARLLQDRLQRVKDDLIATAKVEHQAHDDSDAMVRALAAKTRLDDEDKRRLLLADYEQRKVTSRLASVSQEIEHLVEERELNRLDDERELDREKDLRDASKDLAERVSPLVSRELDDARRSPELDERTKAHLFKVPDLQDEVEKAILLLAARIEKWADFADIVREVRDILGDQKIVTEGTEAEAKKSSGENPK